MPEVPTPEVSASNQYGGSATAALFELVSNLTDTVADLQNNFIRIESRVGSALSSADGGTSAATFVLENRTSAAARSEAQLVEFTLQRQSAYRNSDASHNVRNCDSSLSSSMGPINTVSTPYGLASQSLELVETVRPSIRQNIIAGRDVNLAALLIQYYDSPVQC